MQNKGGMEIIREEIQKMTYEIQNKDEMKNLRNAMSYHINPVRIIDPDAKDDDDVKNSYIGKYVAKCDICNQLVYLDTDELTVDVDICPYCKFDGCLVMIGLIGPLPVHDAGCDNEDTDGFNNGLSPRENIYGKCYKDGTERK